METVNPDRSYTAPPIIQAVIDLQFLAPLSEGDLRTAAKELKTHYANELVLNEVTSNLDVLTKATTYGEVPHLRLSSLDETDLVIASLAKLTWLRLPPYIGWSAFLARFVRDFEIVSNVSGPRELARIGLRYINRIDIPSSNGLYKHDDYLTINLQLPPLLDQINNYGWRIEKAFPENKLISILQSASVEPEIPGTRAFSLDIDIIAQEHLPVCISDIVEKLSLMRSLKNTIFELSVSDKVRDIFKQ